MTTRHPAVVFVLSGILAAATSGCATYRPTRLPTYPPESFRTSVRGGDVILAAESWFSRSQSKLYFDTDLTKRAVVPVHVALTSQRAATVRLRTSGFRLTASNLGEPVAPIPFDDVAQRMRRKSVGPAFAWGVLGLVTLFFAFIFTPMGSALAISQTSAVNERLKRDIWTKILKDGDLNQGQTARGVAFFEVPRGLKRLEAPRLRCTLTVDDATTPLEMEIPLS